MELYMRLPARPVSRPDNFGRKRRLLPAHRLDKHVFAGREPHRIVNQVFSQLFISAIPHNSIHPFL
jgi:hypothetical protein